MKYQLQKDDFNVCFEFALNYHLSPIKSASTRTAGQTRGLGGVLDSFINGKLIEIGVAKILEQKNSSKKYKPDFDIKSANEVIDEPDITKVIEGGRERKPYLFLEIKNTSPTDRWVGLTQEQFQTIKKNKKTEDIYIIGASIENNTENKTKKEKDPLGIYLKAITTSTLFERFAEIANTYVKLEYIITGKELEENGVEFNKNNLLYETEIFEPVSPLTQKFVLSGKFTDLGEITNTYLSPYQLSDNYPAPEFLKPLMVNGTVQLFQKNNRVSRGQFLYCKTPTIIEDSVLGVFNLEKDRVYSFNLTTLGRNPVLARNNIWIAKRAVNYLEKIGKIKTIEESIEDIVNRI